MALVIIHSARVRITMVLAVVISIIVAIVIARRTYVGQSKERTDGQRCNSKVSFQHDSITSACETQPDCHTLLSQLHLSNAFIRPLAQENSSTRRHYRCLS